MLLLVLAWCTAGASTAHGSPGEFVWRLRHNSGARSEPPTAAAAAVDDVGVDADASAPPDESAAAAVGYRSGLAVENIVFGGFLVVVLAAMRSGATEGAAGSQAEAEARRPAGASAVDQLVFDFGGSSIEEAGPEAEQGTGSLQAPRLSTSAVEELVSSFQPFATGGDILVRLPRTRALAAHSSQARQ